MDGFDLVRRKAETLHTTLVAAGVDALDPYKLVLAAANHLKLDLVWLTPGDPALKGSRALLDDQSGTICCEDIGTPAERAILVAHEIGHSEVHSGSTTCHGEDIDVTRSTETAPVGLQRVEDYGARERRELQANVFAREFLLPRPVAARLHLNEEMTAAAISARTNLPLPLVRQQLFDVLLLPTMEASPTRKAFTPVEDNSQHTAAAHRGSAFQLQAGPGTGKTRTLVNRVSSLLQDGIDPSAILILTFSNRAAGELAERLGAVVPEAASKLWIGTFHAFGLDLVRRHHDRLGLSPDPALFDRSDAIAVLEEILPTLPLVHYRNLWDPAMVLRDIVVAISRAKDEMKDNASYRMLAEAMKVRADSSPDDEALQKAAGKCVEIAAIYDLYEAALRKHGGVDFGDLIMRPAQLLENDEALRVAVQLRHRHVLVDEYQDVNRASARLLKAISGDGERLWVVGDSRQSIYRFRGASSQNMVGFKNEYKNAAVDQLRINYRSTEQIVQSFVAVSPHMRASTDMLPLTLKAACGAGPENPQTRQFETLDEEEAGIAASILELEGKGVALRDQAVLCRSNNRLNQIATALEVRGIPVLHLGSLFEREEVRDLLALMSIVVDPFGDGLVRVGSMPRYRLKLQDVRVISQFLRQHDGKALQGLQVAASAAGLSDEGRRAIAQLAKDYAGFSANVSGWDFLSTYLLDRTDLGRTLANAKTVSEKMRAVAVWQFLNFIRAQSPVGSGLPIQRILDRVRQLVLLAEERDLRQVPAPALHLNAVRLMTVHGSKGLEFEAVHLPGLTVSSFPSSYQGQRCPPPEGMIDTALSVSDEAKRSHEEEEECLFFVALSRAEKHLRLYLARKQASGQNRSASPYLSWLPASLIDEVKNPPTIPLPASAPRLLPISVKHSPEWVLTDSRLGLYEKCPRRFFYTHILGLGGGKKPTAFSRTHDCIYELLRWLANARNTTEPSAATAEAAFDEIWQKAGPTDHAFAADYRRLAGRLVHALIKAGAGRRFKEAQPLAIDFPSGRVFVKPDELAHLPDGSVVIRKVRTGKKSTNEYDKLEYTLYHLAAQANLNGRVLVQALHLTDEVAEDVEISTKKLKTRQDRSEQILAAIAGGHFPTEPDAVTCPRCPHFFICAATPEGDLQLN